MTADTLREAPLPEAHDPFADPAPRPFAVGYRKGAGEGLVYGGLIAAVLGAAVAVFTAAPAFLAATAGGLALAFHYYPLIETRRPQLGANNDGLFVAGIGFIAWPEIARLDLFQTAVRQIRLSTLIIDLRRPLDEAAVRAEHQAWWRAAMTRSFSRKGKTRLEVPLHPLAGAPHEIYARLQAYTGPRAAREHP